MSHQYLVQYFIVTKFMRFGILWEIRLWTLGIGLESFILGLGVVNEIWHPLGDTASMSTRGVFSSYRVSKHSIDSV